MQRKRKLVAGGVGLVVISFATAAWAAGWTPKIVGTVNALLEPRSGFSFAYHDSADTGPRLTAHAVRYAGLDQRAVIELPPSPVSESVLRVLMPGDPAEDTLVTALPPGPYRVRMAIPTDPASATSLALAYLTPPPTGDAAPSFVNRIGIGMPVDDLGYTELELALPPSPVLPPGPVEPPPLQISYPPAGVEAPIEVVVPTGASITFKDELGNTLVLQPPPVHD